jgi:hypothetical protein
MGGVRDSELFTQFSIPFVTGGLNQVLNLTDAIADALLFDDGDDGIDGSETLIADINQALRNAGVDGIEAGWSGTRLMLIATDPDITSFTLQKLSGSGYDDLGFVAGITPSTHGLLTALNAPAGFVLSGNASFRLVLTTGGGPVVKDVLLEQALTSANESIGNDRSRLLSKDNSPTFNTAQGLAFRLLQTMGLAGSTDYDPAEDVLTYTIDLSHDLLSLDIPIDFGFDLGPVGSVNTAGSPKITLDASVDFSVTLGVKLGDTGGKVIEGTDQLISLKGAVTVEDVIKPEFAAQPGSRPPSPPPARRC